MTGVHVRHWPGSPDRPALALHCMMGSAAYWGPIADRLDGRIDLRAFDMPSHGRSAAWVPQEGTNFHTTVTRIAAGMIDRPLDLIGHSIGATVALRLAVAAPDAVRSLTLIEPVLFAAAGAGTEAVAGLAEPVMRGDMETAARMFLDRWGGPGGYESLPAALRPQVQRQMPLVLDSDTALSDDSYRILRPGGLEAI
ncbi:MAG TPA: alpha/beta fold hydrolase, partial [Paracoccus sp. (in: a-proteobacteria)]|nr:alpha/beta fold hydrolase [Paracoccus sp. (in: a-proteobacteria)]